MKIIYIITQADGGGAQTYTLALAKYFRGAVAAGNEAGALFYDAEAAGLKTFRLKHLKRNISPWHDLMAVFEIARLIRKECPDIVHLNSTKAGLLGSLTKPFHKSKIIFTAHGFRFLEPLSPLSKNFYLFLEKFASKFRDYIISVSEVDRQSALSNKIIAQNKISTIYNGLNYVDFLTRDEARAKLKLPGNKFIFGTIANFYQTKGLDILINVVAKLDREILSQIIFVILGSGPESPNLKSQISNLKLETVMLTPGSISNGKMCLPAFDAYILPSRKEGFPYALLEAMQAGLPIIATKVGGIPEAVGDAAILVPPEDPNSLANAITSLLRSIELRQQLSQKAKDRSKLFTEQKMLEETSRVYASVKGDL